MYSILSDYLEGIATSCKINIFAKNVYNDPKLFRLVKKIIKYNFMMHFFPIILVQLVLYLTGVSIESILTIVTIPISIFSVLFHLLHYMDLVNIVNSYSSKNRTAIIFHVYRSDEPYLLFCIAINYCNSKMNDTMPK